ncbi:hypothetical protein ICN46_06620 [Polynucleobacter sp. Latsch14-2]|uniref:hypothetical protein n=1 Tax=Polynucleobacter sp. Latsch14-2 TaxID=2576920 RepID=UPI001C0C5B0B|nr:hypothetical protein [Polynucleobacter sp. Latsch14-2]MBU3614563.1 hypothetical protein [Polynucleobacter sp. Latsch14-2]
MILLFGLIACVLPYSVFGAGFGTDLFPKTPVGSAASPTSAAATPAKPMPPSANPASPPKPTSNPTQVAPMPAKQKK